MTDEILRAGPATAEPCPELPARLRKPRLNSYEASEYLEMAHGLKISRRYLDKLRSVGGGPAFNKANRSALYPRASIDAWALARLGTLRSSTSDMGAMP